MNNISELFFDSAKLNPELAAIIDKNGEIIQYQKLSLEVKQLMFDLSQKGIGKGDRVLILLPMGINLYRTVLAVFGIGATAVFLDPFIKRSSLESALKNVPCKALIGSATIRLISRFLPVISTIKTRISPIPSGNGKMESIAENLSHETALITFTTGSTGIPKGANRTHAFLKAQFEALKPMLENDCNVDMTVLPIVLLLNLASGKTSVIADFPMRKPHKFDGKKIIRQLQTYRVESFSGSPWFALQLAKNNSNYSLKQITTGGGPLFPADAQEILNAFPSTKLSIVYGSTEAEPIAHTNGEELLQMSNIGLNGLFVGKIDESAEVKIIPITDEALTEISELTDGTAGEIIVSGNHVLKHYINYPEAERMTKISVDGKIWHRTGDAGYLKNEHLFLLGRCNQRFFFQEQYFYPFLLEYQLKTFTGILEGTVVWKNNHPHIFAVKKAGANPQNPAESLGLSGAECTWLKALPKDPRHQTKIDYSKLLE